VQINYRYFFNEVIFCRTLNGLGQLSQYSYWLWVGRSGNRIPVGSRFSSPVKTGPGAHPASCTMGTGALSQGQSGRGVCSLDHSPPSSTTVKEREKLHLYSPSGPSWQVMWWTLTFTCYF